MVHPLRGGLQRAVPISDAPTHDPTHLGLARGSGSFRAFPTGFFSASSAVTRWNSASTFPCTKKNFSFQSQRPAGASPTFQKSVIMWEITRKYFDYPAALFFLVLGEAISMMDNKSHEMMLLLSFVKRESPTCTQTHIYCHMCYLTCNHLICEEILIFRKLQ